MTKVYITVRNESTSPCLYACLDSRCCRLASPPIPVDGGRRPVLRNPGPARTLLGSATQPAGERPGFGAENECGGCAEGKGIWAEYNGSSALTLFAMAHYGCIWL